MRSHSGQPGEPTGLENFLTLLGCGDVYTPGDIKTVMDTVRPNFRIVKSKTGIKYFNVPMAFDIETSSFIRYGGDGEPCKCATMYGWTFGMYGLVVLGRTWEQFLTMLDWIATTLQLHDKKRVIVYVHNLAYEFQFFCRYFTFLKVFAVDSRKPVYAVTTNGIEFRCSYILSGYSLKGLGNILLYTDIRKLDGDLDYDKLRHCQTPLTPIEEAYMVNDVKVVMAYVEQRIRIDGDISKILLTKTSYVRHFCRNKCFYNDLPGDEGRWHRMAYQKFIKGLTLDRDSYDQCKRAFAGGFTHCNVFYSGKTMSDVTSWDFTSSYPYVMVAEQFPLSSPELVYIDNDIDFNYSIQHYCCIFDIRFKNLEPKILWENPLSRSKCWQCSSDVMVNNGRVVSAAWVCTTLTEQDYITMTQFYTWESASFGAFRRYRKGYLPTPFVQAILNMYGDKTTLKDVEGREMDYLIAKENVNSCYGMTVTDIVQDNHEYTDHWLDGDESARVDVDKALAQYNKSSSRFLYYPWGVYVTAYARRNLFTGILEAGTDYVYSDTDSNKIINAADHMGYIDYYNQTVQAKLARAMEHHKLDINLCAPKTIRGVTKTLGVWDFDAHYSRFKSLGAKRYMVEYSEDGRNKKSDRGKINITVSGLNKQTCVPYLKDKFGTDIFDHFADGLTIGGEYTGKMTHTYIDLEQGGMLTDYLGNTAPWHELSAVHMEYAPYSLGLSREYVGYIMSVKEGYING